MSNWLVAIVGGAIATVIGGVALFYILPAQHTPASSLPVVATPGTNHLKCMMDSGPMSGRVYTFTIDTMLRKVWSDEDGSYLSISRFDEQGITIDTALPYPNLPTHDHVRFQFNRLTMVVGGILFRKPTPDEVASCRATERPGGLTFCDIIPRRVGEESHGSCAVISRAF
jgi:hypothetical protein